MGSFFSSLIGKLFAKSFVGHHFQNNSSLFLGLGLLADFPTNDLQLSFCITLSKVNDKFFLIILSKHIII